MSWLGIGLGDAGSQVSQGVSAGQDWRQRQQQAVFDNARQKLAMLMAPLQLKELQNRLSEFGQPKPEGLVGTQGGGTAGTTFNPGTGQYSLQPLVPGADPASIKKQIQSLAASAPKEYQAAIGATADSIDMGEDPLKALDKAQQLVGQAAGKESSAAQKTRFKLDMKQGIVSDAQGKEYSIYDPQLPPDLKQLVDSARQEDTKKASIEAKKFAEQTARMFQMNDMRESAKAYDNTLKVAQRGISGHSFLKTVQDQVNQAGANGGAGTTAGDMALIEGYMQLMFGVDPKALRGSPQMQQQMLKQGGVDDRAIAWYNSVTSGGKLSQDVRQQILDTATQQVQTFDQAVNQTGQLVDNPKVKDLVTRYNRATGGQQQSAGGGQAGPPPPPLGYVLDNPGPSSPKEVP
jgi:hypothetical protein